MSEMTASYQSSVLIGQACNFQVMVSGHKKGARCALILWQNEEYCSGETVLKTRSSYWKLLPFIKPHSRKILEALACTIGYIAFWPPIAWVVGEVVESIGKGNVSRLGQFVGIIAAIFLVRGFLQYGQIAWMAQAGLAVALDLRNRVYTHLQALNLSYFESARTGDLSYRLTEDVDRVGEVINRVFHQFVPSILQLVVVVGYMVYVNWQLTIATFLIAPVVAGLVGWFGEKLLASSRRSQHEVSNLSSLLTEVFSGIRLIRAFAAEDYEIARFRQEAERNRHAKYVAERLKAIQFPVIGFLEAMGIACVFLLGGWQISQGNLAPKAFASYLAAVAMLIDPIAMTTNNYNEFKQGEASVDRLFELLAIQPSVLEKPEAIDLPPVTGKVEYRHVSFAYLPLQPISTNPQLRETTGQPSTTEPATVLKDLNLLVHPGEMVALVGASGAGKTTLVNLLPRFYDPQDGEVLLDGINVRDVTLRSLRRQIGIVPQETVLFSGTIAQNIAFGQATFDLDAVVEAAKIANAHQFISQFSAGYQTWVGERGVNLSGGQRQRLAIARAVLLNPRILILDEATSALDSESEALVQEALERLMRDRTVFIIAHRLATVRKANRILVLEQGQVVESGTHDELLNQGDRYARFYAQQFS